VDLQSLNITHTWHSIPHKIWHIEIERERERRGGELSNTTMEGAPWKREGKAPNQSYPLQPAGLLPIKPPTLEFFISSS
jgi:hypothetical protein